jgi:hypothetical protein
MSDKILVVTSPDDTLLDGIRILHVELTHDQSQVISSALLKFTVDIPIINYVWKTGEPVSWLLDKKAKSDFIIFNADAANNGATEMFIGYIAAQPNSYYFGNLRDFGQANNRAIYTDDDITNLIEKTLRNYE